MIIYLSEKKKKKKENDLVFLSGISHISFLRSNMSVDVRLEKKKKTTDGYLDIGKHVSVVRGCLIFIHASHVWERRQ